MTDQKKTEEFEEAMEALLHLYVPHHGYYHLEHEKIVKTEGAERLKGVIRDHLKSTRREYARRAFEAGKTGVVVGKWDEANREYRLEDQETYKTFEQWESEQEKGK